MKQLARNSPLACVS